MHVHRRVKFVYRSHRVVGQGHGAKKSLLCVATCCNLKQLYHGRRMQSGGGGGPRVGYLRADLGWRSKVNQSYRLAAVMLQWKVTSS